MAKPTGPKTRTVSEARRTGVLHRAATLEVVRADDGGDSREIKLSFSSEEKVDRWFGDEILDHDPKSIRLGFFRGGTAPLLMDHNPRDQVGVIVGKSVSFGNDRVGRANARFGPSARAEEVLADVRDGIRANVSVGYRVYKYVRDEMDGDQDHEVYRAVDWEPLEISLVSVPADQTVGVGRAGDDEIETIFERNEVMKGTGTAVLNGNQDDNQDGTRDAPRVPAVPKFNADAEAEKVRKAEVERIQDITEMGRQHKLPEDMVQKAIREGVTHSDFAILAMDHLADTRPNQVRKADSADVGMTEDEAGRFSFVRALNALSNPRDRRAQEAAAFEFEASAAAEKRSGMTAKGIMVPADVMKRAPLSVGTATAGGNLVATNLLTASFIELLRAREVLSMMGATYLTDLVGNIAIPKHTGGAAAYWISTEGGDAAETAPAFGQVPLSPKTLGAYTDIMRQLLIQSSLDVELFVRMELIKSLSREISSASLYADGTLGAPKGITEMTGINTTTFAAANPTFVEVVGLESQVAADDADVGSLGYLCNAAMRGHFKSTEKFAGTGQTIWEPGNTVNGYMAGVSNQVAGGDLLFGNWADLLIGMWGGVDLLVDPYTNSKSGTVRVVVHQSVDLGGRHPESFCHSNDGV